MPSRNNLSEPDSGFVNLGAAKDNTSDRKARGDPTALPVITEDASPAFKEPAVEDEAATSGGPLGKLSGQFSKDSQRNGNTCMQNSFILSLPLAKITKYQLSSFCYVQWG